MGIVEFCIDCRLNSQNFFLRVNSIFKDIFFIVLVSFWRYPDPDPYRLKRIRPNYTDPFGSGSETLLFLLRLEVNFYSSIDLKDLVTFLIPLTLHAEGLRYNIAD